jgi:hypothetical protein
MRRTLIIVMTMLLLVIGMIWATTAEAGVGTRLRAEGFNFNVSIPEFSQSPQPVAQAAGNQVAGQMIAEQEAMGAVVAHVNWVLGIGYALHECEQGGTANEWYIDGYAGNGLHVQGGLGMAASLYVGIAGHSALQDSPEQQIFVGYIAKVEQGANWGGHCAPIANAWLG